MDLVEVLKSGELVGLLAGAGARLRINPSEHISFGVTHEAPDFSITGAVTAQPPGFQRGDAHAKKRGSLASRDELDRYWSHGRILEGVSTIYARCENGRRLPNHGAGHRHCADEFNQRALR